MDKVRSQSLLIWPGIGIKRNYDFEEFYYSLASFQGKKGGAADFSCYSRYVLTRFCPS
jgi:hypothetical protein